MKYVLIIAGIAFLLEHLSPWLLQTFFPQSLLAPAPDIPARPQRTASRQDAYVDNEMDSLADTQNINNARYAPVGAVDSDTPVYGDALISAEAAADFDYDEFRPAARDDLANGRAGKVESASIPLAQGGVPDIFDDEATGAHA